MALKREIQYRDVHFGIQGIDSVEKQLGSLRKIAREQLQDAKNTLQVMQKGTAEYDAQVKKMGLLEKEMDRLTTNANKLVKRQRYTS